MNTREIGEYFAKTFELILKKHNAYGHKELVESVRKEFFKTVKKENVNFNLMVYKLSKDLKSEELIEFVNGFYTERLVGDFYSKILKLKHLSLSDFKDDGGDGTLFIF